MITTATGLTEADFEETQGTAGKLSTRFLKLNTARV